MPLVSIVTCTFNRAHLIGETIQSALDQTFQDFEYIIIDDGSEDDTELVVNSFHEPRITYLRHERTGGHLSRLRNFSHSQCKGEYIAYIDSDDIWEKNKLELQINELEKNKRIGFSFTDISVFNNKGIIRNTIYNSTGSFAGSVFQKMLNNELIICHTTLVIRKSCLEKTGSMDEGLHSGDHDLVLLLSRLFDAFVIYQPLVRVRKHDQNSTSNHDLELRLLQEHHQSLQKLYKKQLISTQEYQNSIAATSYSFGVQLLPSADYTSARKYFLKGLRIKPWNYKAWIRLLATLTK